MSRPRFVRLPDGRLWHVAAGELRTVCDRLVDSTVGDGRLPEWLDGIVPSGAWVCSRCRGLLAEWLRAVDMAIAADPRTKRAEPLPETPVLPWWMTPRSWSAEAIWAELAAECEGRPFTAVVYAQWVLREHLNPWGFWPRVDGLRTRELVAA